MKDEDDRRARVPPTVVRASRVVHSSRTVPGHQRSNWIEASKGRPVGNDAPHDGGRRTGQERTVILGYFEDGPNLVTMAMNGWADAEPAWWLNLQAHPDATVDLADGPRTIRGRAAEGEERSRLWARWRELDKNLDGYAALRSGETAVVVLEPSQSRP